MVRGRKNRSRSSSRSAIGRPVTSRFEGILGKSDGVLGFGARMVAQTTVAGLLRAGASQHPDKLFVWSGDDRRTFAEMDAASDRVAGGLAELGVAAGDRGAVLSNNRIEVVGLV